MASNPYTLGRLTRQRSDGTSYWSFCIIWREGETRRRVSLGTTDRIAAEQRARRYWATMAEDAVRSVGDVMERYFRQCDDRRKRDAWAAAKPYWAGLLVEDVTIEDSRRYHEWRKRAVNTVRNELSCLRAALRWAEREKLIDKAPAVHVPAMPPSSVEHLTKAEFRRFLTGCGMPHVKLFAILAVTTGARKTALLQCKWAQVDWDRALLDLSGGATTPGNKSRATVALNDRAMEALREAKKAALTEWLIEYRDGPIADIKKGIAAASQRSGVRCHPHMFRHSAAVWMAEDRVPMTEIAAFLGHKDVNITIRVYARYHPDYLRTAARSLNW